MPQSLQCPCSRRVTAMCMPAQASSFQLPDSPLLQSDALSDNPMSSPPQSLRPLPHYSAADPEACPQFLKYARLICASQRSHMLSLSGHCVRLAPPHLLGPGSHSDYPTGERLLLTCKGQGCLKHPILWTGFLFYSSKELSSLRWQWRRKGCIVRLYP